MVHSCDRCDSGRIRWCLVSRVILGCVFLTYPGIISCTAFFTCFAVFIENKVKNLHYRLLYLTGGFVMVPMVMQVGMWKVKNI